MCLLRSDSKIVLHGSTSLLAAGLCPTEAALRRHQGIYEHLRKAVQASEVFDSAAVKGQELTGRDL